MGVFEDDETGPEDEGGGTADFVKARRVWVCDANDPAAVARLSRRAHAYEALHAYVRYAPVPYFAMVPPSYPGKPGESVLAVSTDGSTRLLAEDEAASRFRPSTYEPSLRYEFRGSPATFDMRPRGRRPLRPRIGEGWVRVIGGRPVVSVDAPLTLQLLALVGLGRDDEGCGLLGHMTHLRNLSVRLSNGSPAAVADVTEMADVLMSWVDGEEQPGLDDYLRGVDHAGARGAMARLRSVGGAPSRREVRESSRA